MRRAFLLIPLLTGCIFGLGRGDDADITEDEDQPDLALMDCQINCDMDSVDFEIRALDAEEAVVELWVEAELAHTFELNQIDDETWVGYEDWPAGLSFEDCSGTRADWVCIVRNGDDEERDAR